MSMEIVAFFEIYLKHSVTRACFGGYYFSGSMYDLKEELLESSRPLFSFCLTKGIKKKKKVRNLNDTPRGLRLIKKRFKHTLIECFST